MNFRARLFAAFLLAVLLPIIALALVIRHEMTGRLTAQYDARVVSRIEAIEKDLAELNEQIDRSIADLRRAALQDNLFRRDAVDRTREDRQYLLDYAGGAMRLAGLTMLQIQDEDGRIISSGHFRNEYDRLDLRLPLLLRSVSGRTALAAMRAPDAPFLALARVDSLQMGERELTLVAGVAVGQQMLARLAGEGELSVSLLYPGGVIDSDETGNAGDERAPDDGSTMPAADASDHTLVRDLEIPFIGLARDGLEPAMIRVTHDMADLHALIGSVNRWFLIATAAAVILVIILATWLSSLISRPLAALAARTEQVDLDRLDVDFGSNRSDEIGVLSRGLESMTERLRASTVMIKEAERRAALGDLARQVNHDIKNALTPIRNIVRHLTLTGRDDPSKLPDVLAERQGTLESGIEYLGNLATSYARLSPQRTKSVCDLNEIVRRIAGDMQSATRVELRMEFGVGIFVAGDAVSLRRIFENIMRNAVDSYDSRTGTVSIRTERVSQAGEPDRVRVAVVDTGGGMSEAVRSRIFTDFYTTKKEGTGLGLSIVRRLVMDLDGSIRVESEAGVGSRFIVDLPAAGRGDDAGRNIE
jgi:signal transduction histidine kinase